MFLECKYMKTYLRKVLLFWTLFTSSSSCWIRLRTYMCCCNRTPNQSSSQRTVTLRSSATSIWTCTHGTSKYAHLQIYTQHSSANTGYCKWNVCILFINQLENLDRSECGQDFWRQTFSPSGLWVVHLSLTRLQCFSEVWLMDSCITVTCVVIKIIGSWVSPQNLLIQNLLYMELRNLWFQVHLQVLVIELISMLNWKSIFGQCIQYFSVVGALGILARTASLCGTLQAQQDI